MGARGVEFDGDGERRVGDQVPVVWHAPHRRGPSPADGENCYAAFRCVALRDGALPCVFRRRSDATSLGIPSGNPRGPPASEEPTMTDTLPRADAVADAAGSVTTPPLSKRVDIGDLPVVHTRHWFRWSLGIVVLFVIAQFAWSLVTNENYEWDVFAHYFFVAAGPRGRGADAPADSRLGDDRLPAGHTPRARPAGEVATAELRGVAVHLVLPLGPARRPDPRLVQPRLPLPDARTRHPVHHGLLDRRVPDGQPDQRVRGGGPRPRACTRRRTRPRSSAAACCRSTRASSRRPRRSASRLAVACPASSCRRPCARSSRTPPTRSSAWSRARRSSS